jgi:hypothetical protein
MLYFSHGCTAVVGPGLLYEVHRLHSDTPHSVGLLWTRDRPVAETSTCQHTALKRDIHDLSGIRSRNPKEREAADARLTAWPLGSAQVLHSYPYLYEDRYDRTHQTKYLTYFMLSTPLVLKYSATVIDNKARML